MKTTPKNLCIAAILGLSALALSNCATGPVAKVNTATTSRSQIASESHAALADLYAKNPHARKLGTRATAVLVFPNIIKGGLIVGAEGGNGALVTRGGGISKFYQTAGASYGLQAGVQKFGYALFLLHPDDVKNLDRAGGWDVGSSPSVVVVDRGAATEFTAKRLEKGTYAIFFDQRGLMAGIGLQGTKITRIHPGP